MLFLCPPRKYAETFQRAIFQNEFTFWCLKLNIYIQKTKFTSQKQHLFDLFSIEMQMKQLQINFYSVCMLLVQLASMNILYSIG